MGELLLTQCLSHARHYLVKGPLQTTLNPATRELTVKWTSVKCSETGVLREQERGKRVKLKKKGNYIYLPNIFIAKEIVKFIGKARNIPRAKGTSVSLRVKLCHAK